jgi:16S rRNA (cytosine1402-N4)-methyltransferase
LTPASTAGTSPSCLSKKRARTEKGPSLLFAHVRTCWMDVPEFRDLGRHLPVLVAEVLVYLEPAPGQTIVDATLGAGGHARHLVEHVRPGGWIIGLDCDETMLALAGARLATAPQDVRVTIERANFGEIRKVLDELSVPAMDGVLADLGVCSDQLHSLERGLSFQQPGPLDMRLDLERSETARSLLRRLSERDLADLFWKYGEERFSRRIARRIVESRRREPVVNTTQLADLVRRCVPRPKGRRSPIDPATRVFQALRIAVNDELGSLGRLLAALPACVKPGGRAVIISFHSLEDRLVKNAFRDKEVWEVLTPKPVQAGDKEVEENPRSRSAKLRAARRRSTAR